MKKIENLIDGTAIAYFLAYKCLAERNKEVSDYYQDELSVYIFPAATVAAFSCEVAIKNLLMIEKGKTKGGHDLQKLFYALSKETQRKYLQSTVRLNNLAYSVYNKESTFTPADFTEKLNKNRLTFTKCRYLYEGIEPIDLDFMETFMFALNDIESDYRAFLDSKMRTNK